jgi:Cu-Zn family superoxide dismutase
MGGKSALAAFLLGAAFAFSSPASAETAKATLKDAGGNELGDVILADTPSGLLITVSLTAVPPGVHGFHIHAVGKCEPPDFKSAGGHFNPDNTKHGLLNPEGPHAGDLPNLHVPAESKLTVEVLNPAVTLTKESALLDADGSAIVIDSGPDDYMTDPDGNAGDHIACGVVEGPPINPVTRKTRKSKAR